MRRQIVINRSRCLQSPCKSFMLRVCGITKSCITMKVISLWATRIRWLFSFYLPIFLLWLYRRVLWRLQKVLSFFLFALFFWYLHRLFEKVETTLNGNFHFFIKTQGKRQTLGLSSPISLLTKTTIWTLQLLVQNWSKTPLSACSSVWRRIHVCPSTWQIWMITLTICYVNCFHLTITSIQTSSSPTIFGITTVLR